MSQLTIDRMLRDRARITPQRVAIVERDRRWTYAELDARSEELAAGLEHGTRISTLTGNSGEHAALMFALCQGRGDPSSDFMAARIGGGRLPARRRRAGRLPDRRRAPEARRSGTRARARTAAFELGGGGRPARPDADDPLLLIYTSGTTGKPEGALLPHANCFWTNLSFDLATGIRQDDVILQVLPQFHCGG